jgi:hypothetical protein
MAARHTSGLSPRRHSRGLLRFTAVAPLRRPALLPAHLSCKSSSAQLPGRAPADPMQYRGHTFNAVDTPGHADFGGEVER